LASSVPLDEHGVPPTANGVRHVPTALEIAADPADLAIIREMYGSRAQTIINLLLAMDGYVAWYYPFKETIPFMCKPELRLERAYDNCIKAI
jgi:hypothetical protein